MPIRNRAQKKSVGKYNDLVDISFLPEPFIRRIDDIFDSYFNLGMKRRSGGIEEESAPEFPSRVSDMSSPDLGNELSKFTAWFSYASDKHKYVLVANNHIELEMQKNLDFELGNLVADKGNIEAKKSKARSSPEYIMLVSYHQKLVGLKTLLDRELMNYDKCISSLSREVTRREHSGGY